MQAKLPPCVCWPELAYAGPEQRPMSAGLCWTRTAPYVCWPVLD